MLLGGAAPRFGATLNLLSCEANMHPLTCPLTADLPTKLCVKGYTYFPQFEEV